MFDDDDDDLVPRFNDVDCYYFEEENSDPVCFSVLPLKFDGIGEVACLDSKKVDLQGFADKGLLRVHTKVVAWRVGLDYEQPKILVLSSEGNWIELLKPRKCYEKTVRSILMTVQMLHFVRKWPRKQKKSLLDHLCEVFNKFDTKPTEYDLKKHQSIIKLFAERDPTLMKSKILQLFTENTSRNIREPILQSVGPKEPTVASSSGDEEDLDNDTDDDYNGNEENIDDDTDDQGNGDDKSNDDYSCNDDDSDDGGTDNLCAICDNGGKLLSCVGQCRRAFHPRKKDGIDSNCESLRLTTAQLQEIDHYMCKNCEYKQHQCFNCGELEPSDGPNAKVFQCYKASCGHFYHPSCIAKLLEPDDTDGACKLETKIAAGMSFTCPAHWCSKCGKMEDGSQKTLWLAVCRRCPVSYHKKCLPRNISFEKKGDQIVRAWHLGDRIIMYCGHHKIEDTIGTPCRDIRLPVTEIGTVRTHCMDHTPSVAEIDRTSNLAKKKAKVTGKRKMNIDQGSTGTTEMSNKLCREADQTQKEAINNSREHISQKGRGEKQAEENKNDTKSGKEKETHKGENAHVRDLIFEKEKILGKESSNKSGLTIGRFTSCDVDVCSPEKLEHAKTTTSNRRGTYQDSESYAGKKELKNPQCNDTPKATELNTSGDKLRLRQEHKEQTTDCNLDLEKNRGKSHMETGRHARYKVQDPQCLHNHTEPDAQPHKSRNRDHSTSSTSRRHSGHNDDQRESGRTKGRSNMGVNSYRGNSPLEKRYPGKRSMDSFPEGQRMDYYNRYPGSNSQHRDERWQREDYYSNGDDDRRRLNHCEDYYSDSDRRRFRRSMSSRCEDYRSDGDVGRRRFSPRQYSPGNCSSVPCPASDLRRGHGGRTRHGLPSYSARHGPFMNSRELEHVHYAIDREAVPLHHDPPNVEYDKYTDPEYGSYNAMDIAPVERYSRQEGTTSAYGPPTDAGMGEEAAFYGGRFRDYEVGSDYVRRNRLNSEDRAWGAGSVTDRYAPHLDRTNNPLRSQGGLRDAW